MAKNTRAIQRVQTSPLTSSSTIIAEIVEVCPHDVQFGGMCVNCGKDMTEYVWVTFAQYSELVANKVVG